MSRVISDSAITDRPTTGIKENSARCTQSVGVMIDWALWGHIRSGATLNSVTPHRKEKKHTSWADPRGHPRNMQYRDEDLWATRPHQESYFLSGRLEADRYIVCSTLDVPQIFC